MVAIRMQMEHVVKVNNTVCQITRQTVKRDMFTVIHPAGMKGNLWIKAPRSAKVVWFVGRLVSRLVRI